MKDANTITDNVAEFLGLTDKPKRAKAKRKAKKKTTKAQPKRKVGRPAKASASKPKRMPKTKLLSMRFVGDSADLTFRDLRKLKTPLKYLDKRLTKLAKRDLRAAKIARDGQSVSWDAFGICVEVAHALRFEA